MLKLFFTGMHLVDGHDVVIGHGIISIYGCKAGRITLFYCMDMFLNCIGFPTTRTLRSTVFGLVAFFQVRCSQDSFNIDEPGGSIGRANYLGTLLSGKTILTHEQMAKDRLRKYWFGLDMPHLQGSKHLLHFGLGLCPVFLIRAIRAMLFLARPI